MHKFSVNKSIQSVVLSAALPLGISVLAMTEAEPHVQLKYKGYKPG